MHKARRRRTILRRRARGLHLAPAPKRNLVPRRHRPQHLAPPDPRTFPVRPAFVVAMAATTVALTANHVGLPDRSLVVDTTMARDLEADALDLSAADPPPVAPPAPQVPDPTAADDTATTATPAVPAAVEASPAAPGTAGGQPAPVAAASVRGAATAAAAPAEATPPAPAPPAPTPPVNRTARVPSGGFQVQGTQIFDPAGNAFKPMGVNLLGPNTWWPRPTQGLSDAALQWGFNTIRLNTGAYDSGIHTNDDLAGIVAEFTSKHIVVMIEMHSFGNGGYPQGGELAALQGWWAQTASQFKDNPYVWFNVMNEPGWEQVVSPQWLSVNEALIQTIRGTGANNLIVLDGAAFAQDAFSWNGGNVNTESSAILTYGPTIAARHGNVAFSFHVYDQWTQGDGKMADYVQRVHGAGLALLAGEVGDAGYVNGQYQDFTPAYDTCIRVCTANGVGIIAWHGQGTGAGEGFRLVNDGPIDTIDNPWNPGNLTHAGQLLWSLTH